MPTSSLMDELFTDVLALCGVGPGERVAVLSEGEVLADYSEAFLRASERLGADAARVNVAAGSSAGAEARIANLAASGLATDVRAMGR